jgi:hypothetical protein
MPVRMIKIISALCAAVDPRHRPHQGHQDGAAHNPALLIRRRHFSVAIEYRIAGNG